MYSQYSARYLDKSVLLIICIMRCLQNEVHGLKLKSPDGFTHCFRFDNEYDYTR